ncbi:hypothetical protein [Neobacillus dielmonensis]|uniref:hypothetical protein n=1 Tax=Neobacillus dielmonensis TaxID=1347369 RepID=UPI0005A8C4C5|nr:hypothetical protein [Neobacillus dielmonensis]
MEERIDEFQMKIKELKQKLKTGERLFFCTDENAYSNLTGRSVESNTFIQFIESKGEFIEGEVEWGITVFSDTDRKERSSSYHVVDIARVQEILNMIAEREVQQSSKKAAALDFLNS